MGNLLVLKVLHEVDGKKAFADTAFAVEDEIETFHAVCDCGLSIRICAMRGPCGRVAGGASPAEPGDGLASVGGTGTGDVST